MLLYQTVFAFGVGGTVFCCTELFEFNLFFKVSISFFKSSFAPDSFCASCGGASCSSLAVYRAVLALAAALLLTVGSEPLGLACLCICLLGGMFFSFLAFSH